MLASCWRYEKLDSLCDKIAVGLAISVTPYMRSEGVKLIRNQNIKRNKFDDHSIVFVDQNFADQNKSKQIKCGDVIAVRTGSNIGEACVVPSDYDGALTFTTLIMRPNKSLLDSNFLCLHINSEMGVSEVNRLMVGGGKPNLNSGELKLYSIFTPPLSEQIKIAEILSTWDNAINTVQKLLANSQQQKKALMQQLLTGKKRFAGFEGEWLNNPLGEIAEVYQSKTISQSVLMASGYPVYGANGIIGFYSEYNHEQEQIAVTCRGSTCGVVNWTKAKSWITGNAMVVNVDSNYSISKKFLYYALDGSNLTYLISGSGQPQITGNIKSHIVKIPDFKEQQKIAAVLTTADQEIDNLRAQLNQLKQEKKSLMQQLLTGKRRVKVEEAA